jgi:hypothetical protein
MSLPAFLSVRETKPLTRLPLAISTKTKALATAWYSESPELQEDRIPDFNCLEVARTVALCRFRSNKLSLSPN